MGSTKDALLIIQAIVDKDLHLISRRPHERERPNLIRLGNVFVFIEEHSGIKRWTDGVAWLPSRILGRFLVYRELDKHTLSEKDDKKKKKRRISLNPDPLAPPPVVEDEYRINGMTNYVFKDQGLIKKTLSLTTSSKDVNVERKEESQTIHLISYYNADDVLSGRLQRPLLGDLKHLNISHHLWDAIKELSLGGKIPIEDEASYFLDTNYQLQNMTLLQQPSYLRHPNLPRPSIYYQNQQQLQQSLQLPPKGQFRHPQYPYEFKREDDLGYPSQFNSNELTFINPFTGATRLHNSVASTNLAVNSAQNSIAGQGSIGGPLAMGLTSGALAGSVASYSNSIVPGPTSGLNASFNPYLMPQYPVYHIEQLQQQQLQQQQLLQLQVQLPQQLLPQQQQNYQLQQGQPPQPLYTPFPPQHFSHMFPQQSHFGSILASSEFLMNSNINGSVLSVATTMPPGGSASNSLSGPTSKKHYRSSSGGTSLWLPGSLGYIPQEHETQVYHPEEHYVNAFSNQ